jgi:hypothetical protein
MTTEWNPKFDEPENLQKHRTTGESIPLTWLDVQVLSEG